MKTLQLKAIQVFCALIDKLGDRDHLKIEIENFDPLSIENIGEVDTEKGAGIIYSLAHYYELNGDLCQAPEMCFVVVDNREDPADYTNVFVYPQMYQTAIPPSYQVCLDFEDGKVTKVNHGLMAELADFANVWL